MTNRQRPKRYTEPADERRRNGPITAIRPDPALWQDALRQVDGDHHRLRALPDGSVLIMNQDRKIDYRRSGS